VREDDAPPWGKTSEVMKSTPPVHLKKGVKRAAAANKQHQRDDDEDDEAGIRSTRVASSLNHTKKQTKVASTKKNDKEKPKSKRQKITHSAAPTILKDIDFRRATVIKRSAASVIRKEWMNVLDDAVKRLCHLSCLASRFLNFYISLVFDAEGRKCIPFGPPVDFPVFDDTFFEHIYKVLVHDTRVQQFEPTLGFARCIFFNKLLVKHKHAESLTSDQIVTLWTELTDLHSAAVKYDAAVALAKKKKAEKKKREEDGDDGMDEDIEEPKKQIIATPMMNSITSSAALKDFLPSCVNLAQCILYERTSMKTAFDQHQHVGLRAHVNWYLVAKYQWTKKEARCWLDQCYPAKEEELVDPKDAPSSSEALTVEQQAERDARRALASAEAKDNELAIGNDDEEDDGDVQDIDQHSGEAGDTRQIWSPVTRAFEMNRLMALDSTNITERVRLHHSIQREMDEMDGNLQDAGADIAMDLDETEGTEQVEEERKESDLIPPSDDVDGTSAITASAASAATASTTARPSLRKFTVAPIVDFSRGFKLFDLKTLQDQCRHPIFNGHGQVRPVLDTVVDIFHEDGDMLGLRPKNESHPTAIRTDYNGRSIRTFRFDGVQIHLMWEKVVSIPCRVDAKRAAKYEEDKKKKLASRQLKPDGSPVDGRCAAKPPAFLAGSDGAIFRPADARLQDYTCGVFQSKSIIATRQEALEQGIAFDKLFPRIVSADPGHSNILSCAVYNHQRHDWDKGPNLSKKHFYHKLKPRRHGLSRQKRVEFRLNKCKGLAAQVKKHQEAMSLHSIKSSRPDDCLENLLLVLDCWDAMFSFYGSKSAAREQFSSEQKRRSLIDRFIQQIAPDHLKQGTIIVLGSAKFATSFKGTQSTPIGMLVKEIAKVRRVVLMDEYNTTAMCSGCNLHGVGRYDHVFDMPLPHFDKNAKENNQGCEVHPLRDKSGLALVSINPKIKQKPHQLQNRTALMVSFRRTVEPLEEKRRRLMKEFKKNKPPDPGGGQQRKNNNKARNPLARRIHGLKQCTRQPHEHTHIHTCMRWR